MKNKISYKYSGVAQRKRVWLITRRTEDRNLLPLNKYNIITNECIKYKTINNYNIF